VGFSELLLDHSGGCKTSGCAMGGAPSGSIVGALGFGLRATVLLGNEL
jgi:hypothetical protein